MYVVCLKPKYDYCKYGNHCDQIKITDECEMPEKCREKYCDKGNAQNKRLKFSIYCLYKHLLEHDK